MSKSKAIVNTIFAIEKKAEVISNRRNSIPYPISVNNPDAEELESNYWSLSETINKSLKELHYQSAEDSFFWHNAPLSVYELFIDKRWDMYKAKFIDSEEADFLISEYKSYLQLSRDLQTLENEEGLVLNYSRYIDDTLKEIFNFSNQKKCVFIDNRLKMLGYEILLNEDVKPTEPKLGKIIPKSPYKISWIADKVDLAELVKALHENGSIKGYKHQKELFNIFKNLFCIDMTERKSNENIRDRYNSGNGATFLKELVDKLDNWNERREDKLSKI